MARQIYACAAVVIAAGIFICGAQSALTGLLQPPWSELARIALFGGFALTLYLGLQRRLLGSLVSALLLGAADEIHQIGQPGCTASVEDWVADIVGAALCLALVSLAVKRESREP